MQFRRRLLANALVAVPAAALILTAAPEARADGTDGIGAAISGIILTGTTVLVTGTVFTIHDVGALAQGQPPAIGWSIAESVLVVPQALLFDGLLGWQHANGERSGFLSALVLVPAAWTGAMSAHGIWSLASPNTDRGTVYGVSWALGANLAFTTGAVGALFDKRRTPPAAFGVLEVLGTTPTILVGAAQLLDPAGRDKGAWTALTAWSGALFVHGAASITAAFVRARNGNDSELDDASSGAKPREGFAPRFHFAPTMVSDGVSRAPGIGVSGVF